MAKIKTFFIYVLGAVISLLTLSFLKGRSDKAEVEKELETANTKASEHDKEVERLEEAKIDTSKIKPTEDDSEEYWTRVLKDDE